MTNQLRAVGILIKDDKILLGEKTEGIGVGNFVAIGGKQDESETIEEALIREMKEEIMVSVSEFHKVASIDFEFPSKPDWNQTVCVYLCTKWDGAPVATSEMSPVWISKDAVPFEKMWEDAYYWYPLILRNKKVKARFVYGEDKKSLIKIDVNVVEKL